jgi:hypothetical protein
MSSPTKDQIDELKSYIKANNGYVASEQMGYCKKCGKWQDLRMGICWDCGIPDCKRDHCPFRKLVYCGQGRKQIFVDLRDYSNYSGTKKIKCDNDKGPCSDIEFAIGLDKEPSLPPVNTSNDNCFLPLCFRNKQGVKK